MKKPASHIALVLFARTAAEEAAHKKLLPASLASRQEPVFEAFTNSSLALLAATGLPYFLISSAQQQGETFGERLYRALDQTFAQGFDQVVVVGNDCPQLSVQDLQQAAGLLHQHGSVLGPCRNGGVYLLGLNKTVFEKLGGFGQIAWQTPVVYQQLRDCLQQQGASVASLAAYADVNTRQDFRQARQQKWFCRSLRSRIKGLLQQLPPLLPLAAFPLIPVPFHSAFRFRGPPSHI